MTDHRSHSGRLEPRAFDGRSLISYLLVPRPTAVLVKGAILWAAVVMGAVFDETNFALPAAGIVVWVLAFELFVYQGRYMWNDLRGLTSDSSDLAARKPDRLAAVGPLSERSMLLVKGVLLVRVVGWLVAVMLLDGPLGSSLLTGGLLVWTIAGVYELGRGRAGRGRHSLDAVIAADVLVYLAVGGGYAVRACLGVWVGSNGSVAIASLIACGIAISAFGTMLVTMTWVIEGTQLVGLGPHPSLAFLEPTGKAHLGPLLRQAAMLDPKNTDAWRPSRDPSHWTPLAPAHGLRNWWNASFLVAAGAGSLFGMAMSAGLGFDGMTVLWGIGAAAIGIIGATFLSIGPLSRRLQPRFLGALVIGSALQMLLSHLAHMARPWGAAVPYAIVTFVYWGFRSLDFSGVHFSATLLLPEHLDGFAQLRRRFSRAATWRS